MRGIIHLYVITLYGMFLYQEQKISILSFKKAHDVIRTEILDQILNRLLTKMTNSSKHYIGKIHKYDPTVEFQKWDFTWYWKWWKTGLEVRAPGSVRLQLQISVVTVSVSNQLKSLILIHVTFIRFQIFLEKPYQQTPKLFLILYQRYATLIYAVDFRFWLKVSFIPFKDRNGSCCWLERPVTFLVITLTL